MGATGIEWTRGPNGEQGYSFNPWIGCTKISAACDFCYAEAASVKFGSPWGPHADRRPIAESTWRAPLAWDRRARREGKRFRVFCASMADVFDNHRSIDPEWRDRLWRLVMDTPNLDWQLLTKRPQNIEGRVPISWAGEWPSNVWIGVTVENQAEADRRIPILRDVPAVARFLSVEPLLGRIDLYDLLFQPCPNWLIDGYPPSMDMSTGARECCSRCDFTGISDKLAVDWVIAGGESGRLDLIRDTPIEHFTQIAADCNAAGVPFFMKQLPQISFRSSYKKFDQFPAFLQVRQQPRIRA